MRKTFLYLVTVIVLIFGILLLVDTIVNKDKVLSAVYYITRPQIINKPLQQYYPCENGPKTNINITKLPNEQNEETGVVGTNDCEKKDSVVIGCVEKDACNFSPNANVPGDCRFAVKEVILTADVRGQQTGRGRVHVWQTTNPNIKLWDEYYNIGTVSVKESGENACDYEINGVKVKDIIHVSPSKPNWLNGSLWRNLFK